MSREIDAKIATEIMGWRTHSHSEILWYTGHISRSKELFKPSTDIAAAFEVLEAMAQKGYYYEVSRSTNGKYYCNLSSQINGRCADTAPMAICLAALKAKGVEVEG